MEKYKDVKGNFQEKIDKLLKNKSIGSQFLDSKTIEEISEEISIYHQELEYQNVELMRIYEELEISKKHYYDLFYDAPLGYVIFDDSYIIEDTNHMFDQMLGLKEDEYDNTSITEFIDPDYQDLFYHHIKDILKKASSHSVKLILKGNGRDIPVKMESKIHYEGGKTLILSALMDMTKEKEGEEALKSTNEQLMEATYRANEASATKSQFLANMSHEIRTPLNGILGFLYLLEGTELNEDQIDYVKKIKVSTETLSSIINDILDISRIESGRLELEKTTFNLTSIIEAGATPFYSEAMYKGLNFEIIIDSDLPELVMGDPLRLRQVIINLLSNAIKFTDKGYIKLNVTLKRECKNEIEMLFKIQDTGIGMDEETINKLFKPFIQADVSSTRKYGGTGLGLVICKNIIEMMGGEIQLDSELGRGTEVSFTVILDKTKVKASSFKDKSLRTDLPSTKADMEIGVLDNKPKLLLVEDNELGRSFFVKLLYNYGLSCDVAENGLMALEKIKKNEYDIVFMDCQMPVMNGYEATKKIREYEGNGKHTTIIAMTAHAMKGDAEKCFESGMDEYISKPIDIRLVIKMINKVIGTNDKEHSNETNVFQDTVKSLMEDSGLDRETSTEIVGEFCTLAAELFEQIKDNYQKENISEVKNLLHQLKGSSGNVRASKISKEAFNAEEAIKSKDYSKLEETLDEIECLIGELTKTIDT